MHPLLVTPVVAVILGLATPQAVLTLLVVIHPLLVATLAPLALMPATHPLQATLVMRVQWQCPQLDMECQCQAVTPAPHPQLQQRQQRLGSLRLVRLAPPSLAAGCTTPSVILRHWRVRRARNPLLQLLVALVAVQLWVEVRRIPLQGWARFKRW